MPPSRPAEHCAERPAYHHGNARAALLAAAAALLEQSGAAGLSLRQLAGRAGLSRQAPYNHFADKAALLAELVRGGYEELAARTRAAAAQAGSDAVGRLAGAADAYIALGQEQPALFRLMFGREFVDLAEHPGARAAAAAAKAEIAAIVGAVAGPAAPAADVEAATLVAWSMVHGYTALCVEAGLEGPEQRAGRAVLFARAIEPLARAARQ